MKLKTVILENFRSFADRVAVEIDDLTALIGKNDAGKSTILEALEIFFNSTVVKIDQNDLNVFSQSCEVRIGCIFDDVPDEISLDSSIVLNLSQDFLLNEDGYLEIHKIFDCSLKSPKSKNILIASHPSLNQFNDLVLLKQTDLRNRLTSLNISVPNSRPTMRQMRQAAFSTKSQNELVLTNTEISLDKDNGTKVWEAISKTLPMYALFQSDRSSKDSDTEVQDPMKIAVEQAIQSVQDRIDEIKTEVMIKATEVAQRTLDQLQQFNPALANQLHPTLVSEPKWEGFKLSLTSDDGIPINKRGSGVRRLVLLSFFKAEVERRQAEGGCSSIIYAVEEPETSQHPNHQEMLINTLKDLSESCQVLLTTHVPALAGLVPVESLRYISKQNGNTIIQSGDAQVYRQICQDLGVLPEPNYQIRSNNVKVIICVEGKHDVSFFKNICRLMLSQDPDIPDIVNDLRVIILPLGGSNLKEWAQSDFLRSLNIPEVHIYDRDFDTPPTYQSACDEVNNRNDNSWATLTSRKEIESYLHHDAINNEFNLTITESDIVSYNYDVPKLVVESILRATSHPLHSNLLRCKKDRDKKNLVKPYLNNQVVLGMTVEMLVQTDPNGDIRNWFEQIRLRLT